MIKNKKKNKKDPGWSQLIKPYKESADTWRDIWVANNRSHDTLIYPIYKRTQNLYHLQVRRLKKMNTVLEDINILKGNNTNNNDLINLIKKKRKTKSNPAMLLTTTAAMKFLTFSPGNMKVYIIKFRRMR